jgi:hypothetical protein
MGGVKYNMRRLIPFVTVLLVILPVAGLASPVISAPQVHFDFGVVAQGIMVQHDFEVENSGDEELVIEKLTGS